MSDDLIQEETHGTLTESPNHVTESPNSPGKHQMEFVIIPEDQQVVNHAKLHPYTRPLTIYDLESVVALENAAFENSADRATREKMAYRLTKCGELCLGIFCTVVPGENFNAPTLATGRPVESSRKNGAISVLLGHIIAAKTTDPTASDKSMDYPKDWASEHPTPSTSGHQEGGRTIVLHSVAILPEFQARGLGRILLMAYVQQMNGAGIADRLALLAHDHKVGWYEKIGFQNKGKSATTFGDGDWTDLTFELKSLEARAAYGN
jgi:ribosomal protein S18 acetylase RimI-like enzyme